MLNESGDSLTAAADEDRYNKLKIIAVKLKKKVAEQSEEINLLNEEKTRLSERSQTASKIQQEFDKAQDEIERLKKNEKRLEKDLKAAIDESVKIKEARFEENSQLQSLSSSHKILREKVDKLEKREKEFEHFKAKAEELQKELNDSKQLQLEGEKDKRQTAILCLEITDYEKKLQDAQTTIQKLQEKLEDKNRDFERSLEDLNSKDKLIEELNSKISSLENQIEQLNTNKETLKAEVGRKNEKINFLQDEISKSNDKFKEKNNELIKLENENDSLKLKFVTESEFLVERTRNLEKTICNLEQKISIFEENKRSRVSQISNLKLELQQLETEYINYKIKAQAMLKTQRGHITKDENSDELENLQKIVQDFHSEISLLKSDVSMLKSENENLAIEKAEAGLRLNKARADTLEKEIRLNNEIQNLRQELIQKETEISNLKEENKIKLDATISSYKIEIESLKSRFNVTIKELKDQLMEMSLQKVDDFSTNKEQPLLVVNDDLQHKIQQQEFRPINDWDSTYSEIRLLTPNQPLQIDTSFDQLRMMPRGECEGSESVSSTCNKKSDNYNISFEQLLNSNENIFESSPKNSELDEELQKKLTCNLKEELTRNQNQVKHLTSLLRESESNSDRLNQLSEALKEEIRRIERDNERKEHLKENTEYLKNVLLKFITLNGEEEKLRLVPVFKTMLRLSPEELEKLESSIKGKGEQPNQGGGWSSYIPIPIYRSNK